METNSKKSAFPIFVLTLVLFLLGIFGVRYLMFLNRDKPSLNKERGEIRLQTRLALDEEDAKILKATEWVDEPNGLARIPIERAMEITATQLRMKNIEPSSVAVAAPVAQSPVAAEVAETPAAETPAAETSAVETPATSAPVETLPAEQVLPVSDTAVPATEVDSAQEPNSTQEPMKEVHP